MHIELEKDVTADSVAHKMASYGASAAREPPKRIKVNGLRRPMRLASRLQR